MKVKSHFDLAQHPKIPLGSRAFYAGCEFEIESCLNATDLKAFGFTVDIDHSLRNNGYEFKSGPKTVEGCLEAFKTLHEVLTTGKDPFSERTSIHVHVNVGELELTEVRQLVLTYALLEPLFLNFVGETRRNSIFCVPLNYTYIPSIYKQPLEKMVDKWHKYTAFNLLPICPGPNSPGLGTVEFRHLYGTKDMAVFKTWLTALEQLYNFVERQPDLNIIKRIEAGDTAVRLAEEAVPILANKFNTFALNEMCKDTMLDVKLAVGGLSK